MIPVSDLPAGIDPDELAAAPPTSARRSRLRKRVSFLRAAREVLLRDLGGFVYELHRTAGDIEHEAHRRLRELKLTRLSRLDAELHELELRLDDVRRHVVVREPGVGGECPHCGELFGSDAHFCSHCGLPLTDSARRAAAHEAAPPAPEPPPAEPHDRPTEEYSSLSAGDTEFRWPARTGAETTSTGASGDEPATADAARQHTTPAEPATAETAVIGKEQPHGAPETPAAGGDRAAADRTGGEQDPMPADDAAPREADGGDGGPNQAGGVPAAGAEPGDAGARDAPDESSMPAGEATHGADPAPDGGRDESAATDRAADDAPDASRGAGWATAPGEDAPAGERDNEAEGRNGRDESAFSPLERRR